jgi:hypothetical protein
MWKGRYKVKVEYEGKTLDKCKFDKLEGFEDMYDRIKKKMK